MPDKESSTRENSVPVSVKMIASEDLRGNFERLYDEIAKRAFSISQNDGHAGRDLDNWFKAETELLHPVHVQVTEADGAVNIEAEVPGFDAKDLDITLEPQRFIITGKRGTKAESKKGKTVYSERCSNEIFRAVSLPIEVDASKARATLKNGILELRAPKSKSAKTAKVLVKTA